MLKRRPVDRSVDHRDQAGIGKRPDVLARRADREFVVGVTVEVTRRHGPPEPVPGLRGRARQVRLADEQAVGRIGDVVDIRKHVDRARIGFGVVGEVLEGHRDDQVGRPAVEVARSEDAAELVARLGAAADARRVLREHERVAGVETARQPANDVDDARVDLVHQAEVLERRADDEIVGAAAAQHGQRRSEPIAVFDAVADAHPGAAPIAPSLDQPLRAELAEAVVRAVEHLDLAGVGDVQGEL